MAKDGEEVSSLSRRIVPDDLVPDPVVAKEFNRKLITIWRWTNDPALNFPRPIKIKNRNFRRRAEIEAFKRHLIELALAAQAA